MNHCSRGLARRHVLIACALAAVSQPTRAAPDEVTRARTVYLDMVGTAQAVFDRFVVFTERELPIDEIDNLLNSANVILQSKLDLAARNAKALSPAGSQLRQAANAIVRSMKSLIGSLASMNHERARVRRLNDDYTAATRDEEKLTETGKEFYRLNHMTTRSQDLRRDLVERRAVLRVRYLAVSMNAEDLGAQYDDLSKTRWFSEREAFALRAMASAIRKVGLSATESSNALP